MIRVLSAIVQSSGRSAMLEAGSKAPDFAVQDHLGRTVRLSDYRGKDVLLWFYPVADTPG
jgi:peroxiredoxin Q/BCP